ncbi:MAG: hypothetical protein H6672_07830 [Anaerolineaceae bacterium]|nr:hypothetical protein [Anaerolineaceae bacterium]
MSLPIILAHGALGIWDEVIFISVAVIFLVVMGISWVRSRVTTPPLAEDPPRTDNTPTTDQTDSPSHFRLD